MIMKYDKMVEITQAESHRKMEIAQKAISGMLDNRERISIAELVRRTGLSRGFFYKNPTVRNKLDDAIRKQDIIFQNQHSVIMDKEIEDKTVNLRLELLRVKNQNEKLSAENQELAKSNEQLLQQVERLQKQLGRKEVSLLKRL